MRISSKAAQEYYFILKSIFPKVTVEEGRFLKEFKTSLIEFTLVHPQCTYDTLIEEFGTPQDILHEYLDTHDANKLTHAIKKPNYKKLVLLIILAGVLICCTAYCIFLIHAAKKLSSQIPDKVIISIIEEEI